MFYYYEAFDSVLRQDEVSRNSKTFFCRYINTNQTNAYNLGIRFYLAV